jgi:hypothetical protein
LLSLTEDKSSGRLVYIEEEMKQCSPQDFILQHCQIIRNFTDIEIKARFCLDMNNTSGRIKGEYSNIKKSEATIVTVAMCDKTVDTNCESEDKIKALLEKIVFTHFVMEG